MRVMALLIGASALGCFGIAFWLLIVTAKFYFGAEYAPSSAGMPGYTAGGVEADGGGIFAPCILLLAIGAFLGRFAFNLWRRP